MTDDFAMVAAQIMPVFFISALLVLNARRQLMKDHLTPTRKAFRDTLSLVEDLLAVPAGPDARDEVGKIAQRLDALIDDTHLKLPLLTRGIIIASWNFLLALWLYFTLLVAVVAEAICILAIADLVQSNRYHAHFVAFTLILMMIAVVLLPATWATFVPAWESFGAGEYLRFWVAYVRYRQRADWLREQGIPDL